MPLADHPSKLTEAQRVFIIQSYYQELREGREFIARLLGAEIQGSGQEPGGVRDRAKRLLKHPE